MRTYIPKILLLICVSGLPAAHAANALPVKPVPEKMKSAANQAVLSPQVEQHRRIRGRLSADDRTALDSLTAAVMQRLFAAPLEGDLLVTTTKLVNEFCAGLTRAESADLAPYVLGGIATQTSAATAGKELSFNTQYLSLQQKMENENKQYAAVSNVLKTKHDTVKNSISNIR